MRKSRELKELARQRMTKNISTLVGATAIYGGIYFAVVISVAVAYTLNLLSKGIFTSIASVEMYMQTAMNSFGYSMATQAVAVFIGALMNTVSVAIAYMCLKTARGQETKISDLLYVVKNNPDKVILIYLIEELIMFLVSVPANLISYYADVNASTLIAVLNLAFTILAYVADIYIAAMFALAMFVYIEDPEKGVLECIETSGIMMRNNISKYVFIVISFIPLYFVSALFLLVPYLFVYPYMHVTMALFYMQLKGELGSTIDVTIE